MVTVNQVALITTTGNRNAAPSNDGGGGDSNRPRQKVMNTAGATQRLVANSSRRL